MSAPSKHAAIWDVDGTLVDTAELHFRAWANLASEMGFPFTRAEFAATFGRRNAEIVRALVDPGVDDSTIRSIGDLKEMRYRSAMAQAGVTLLPGVNDLLSGLQSLNWLQAIGSSAPKANLELILDVTATRGFFAAVVSAEDTHRGKPDPEVFLVAAERLHVSPDHCVVLEDAIAGVEAAKAAGMKCVAVRCVGHHAADALASAGADLVVESLASISANQISQLFN